MDLITFDSDSTRVGEGDILIECHDTGIVTILRSSQRQGTGIGNGTGVVVEVSLSSRQRDCKSYIVDSDVGSLSRSCRDRRAIRLDLICAERNVSSFSSRDTDCPRLSTRTRG